MGWKDRVNFIDEVDADYIAFFDESGIPNENDKSQYFTLTCVLLKRSQVEKLNERFNAIKNKFWDNGLFNNEKVVFHSSEIGYKKGAFKNIDKGKLLFDLKENINLLEFTVFSCTIDKEKYKAKYCYRHENYGQAFTFIIERLLIYVIPENKTLSLIFERRNKKSDNLLHKCIMLLFSKGTKYLTILHISKVNGLYFNAKRTTDKLKSYPGLELADLCSYEIFKNQTCGARRSLFCAIEKNIYGYPKCKGKGLKFFP